MNEEDRERRRTGEKEDEAKSSQLLHTPFDRFTQVKLESRSQKNIDTIYLEIRL
jgi:hypothetical protein